MFSKVTIHFIWIILVVTTLLNACGDIDPDTSMTASTNKQEKTPLVHAEELGRLQYKHLLAPNGQFSSDPLLVSNNPEHVMTYGLLASSDPLAPVSFRSIDTDSPSSEFIWNHPDSWFVNQVGCSLGAAQSLDVYIAHILDEAMGTDRRLSVVIEAGLEDDVILESSGFMGTTQWSDIFGIKTRRSNWLGAQVADARLSRYLHDAQDKQVFNIHAGQRLILQEVRAKSLVEGSFKLEATQGCFTVHIVSHPEGRALDYLDQYAIGDVKWPGWSNGSGYGRAAGIFEGERWVGNGSMKIEQETSAFGWRFLDPTTSPQSLARNLDSSEILFGGYGVVYEFDFALYNQTNTCISATASFTSYAQLPSTHPEYKAASRTPSWATLWMNINESLPSMLWNGPLYFESELRGGAIDRSTLDVILSVDVKESERQDSYATVQSLSKKLFRVDLEPREDRSATIIFPVSGYIVAPIALTVETQPCTQ